MARNIETGRMGLVAILVAAVSLAGCGTTAVDSVGGVSYRVEWGPVQLDGSRQTRIVKCTDAGTCAQVGGNIVPPANPTPPSQ